jgi:deazaflavin-dependent oxidoreductase (nitroreductase family)
VGRARAEGERGPGGSVGRGRKTVRSRSGYRGPVRRLYGLLSSLVIVPIFRIGLGRLLGNPITGYYMVIRTVGRKSGRTRYTAITYAIADGSVYCVAGYGRGVAWYLNALAAGEVGLILPGRRIRGSAEEITEPAERLAAIRLVFRSAGLMGLTEGFDPRRADGATILARTAEMPVVGVRAADVESGAFDPGGRAWLWAPVLLLAIVVAALTRAMAG